VTGAANRLGEKHCSFGGSWAAGFRSKVLEEHPLKRGVYIQREGDSEEGEGEKVENFLRKHGADEIEWLVR